MKIILVTPALPHSRSGNRATALRWRNILRDLGHKVDVTTSFKNGHYDAMIALHAWRSADSINQFYQQLPNKLLIVALTGTDIYKFINSHTKKTLYSIKISDHLVALHNMAHIAIPKLYRKKLSVIYQSAETVPKQIKKNRNTFDICVIGHLRNEKDPLRAAYAVRNLPKYSKIRVKQFGKAHNDKWSKLAIIETEKNLRYHWYGEVPHWRIRQVYGSADLMVLSSKMEGGANVISEACVAGLPIIASDIDGSIGLLGKDYPGYFKTGQTNELHHLLLKAEENPIYLNKLKNRCTRKASLFSYKNETNSWKKLLNKLR